MQQDVLMQTMTITETFTFVANLRVKGTKVEKRELVKKIVSELNLDQAADIKIGMSSLKGISGGERKRVSIGIELITDPSLLFLDGAHTFRNY